jgi:hypothetical protein
MRARFLFVGGCERSGTTLVQKVLCAHSRIAGGPELLFTRDLASLYRKMSGPYPDAYVRRQRALYSEERLAEAFDRFLHHLLEPTLARKPEALWISEKTPSNIAVAAELLGLFPDCRFIHVLRDGRDVLASHRRVEARLRELGERFNRANFRLRGICARWNRACETHVTLSADEAASSRYHLVRFEELVDEPEVVLAKLFGFVALEPEPACRTPERLRAANLGVPVDGAWLTEEDDGRSFDPSRVGRWRSELGLSDRLLASRLMAANLRRMAYL